MQAVVRFRVYEHWWLQCNSFRGKIFSNPLKFSLSNKGVITVLLIQGILLFNILAHHCKSSSKHISISKLSVLRNDASVEVEIPRDLFQNLLLCKFSVYLLFPGLGKPKLIFPPSSSWQPFLHSSNVSKLIKIVFLSNVFISEELHV